jgi:N-acetylmuramoyl-L-alanine amidase
MNMRLLIDVGHGGNQSGAVREGVMEKNVVLEIGHRLIASLGDLPVDAVMDRETDASLSPRERQWAEEAHQADWVLSLHNNAHRNEACHGVEFYHWPGNSRAESVCAAMARALPREFDNRRRTTVIAAYDDPAIAEDDWLQAPRAVLGWFAADAVLAELLYLSNPVNWEQLQDETVQEQLVCVLRLGVCEMLQLHQQKVSK